MLPHPTSGRAVIPFDLERGSEVSLHIYDMLGRQVESLLDAAFLPPIAASVGMAQVAAHPPDGKFP